MGKPLRAGPSSRPSPSAAGPEPLRVPWCERRDLNPRVLPHGILSPARLPVPPLSGRKMSAAPCAVIPACPLLLLLLALVRPAEAAAPRVDPRIFAGKAAGERATVLVVLREQADLSGAAAIRDRAERRRFVYEALRAQAAATQAPLRRAPARAGAAFRAHFLVNMVEVEADAALARGARRPRATCPVVRGQSRGAPAAAGSGPTVRGAARRAAATVEPNLVQVGAPELWARGFTGQGIVVGVADTGFEWDHPALQAQYRGWDGATASHDYNWHDAIHDAARRESLRLGRAGALRRRRPRHRDAGLAVGDDGAGNQIGVAPGARLIGCRNMDAGQRHAGALHRVLRVVPRADRRGRRESAAGPRRRRHQQLLGLSRRARAARIRTSCRASSRTCARPGIAVVVRRRATRGAGVLDRSPRRPPSTTRRFSVGATSTRRHHRRASRSRGPVTSDGSNRLKPDISRARAWTLRTARAASAYTLRLLRHVRPRRRTSRARSRCCGRRVPGAARRRGPRPRSCSSTPRCR